jgi:Holliday junction DNA helicase RuvB
MGARAEEAIYSALEDGFVDAMVADAASARVRPLRIRLERFTLVAATTSVGMLSESFRARFALIESLEPYAPEEISEIVARAAERLGTPAEKDAPAAIARRARGVPREALRILDRARDLAQVSKCRAISAAHVDIAATRIGIDAEGLLKEERDILDLLLDRGRPMGIDAIAETLGLDRETLEGVYEPWLLRSGLIERTERGRQATEAAWKRRKRKSVETAEEMAQETNEEPAADDRPTPEPSAVAGAKPPQAHPRFLVLR